MRVSTHIPLAVFCVVAFAMGMAACYSAPLVEGWYRCSADDQCEAGLVCDDGVCCNTEGGPFCPTRPRGNGLCADGGSPKTMYVDRDGDNFGDNATARDFCAPPALEPYRFAGGDCVDTVGIGATVYPDAGELCDGLDNDCDGVEDDGLSGSTYYQDSDNDGAGDLSVPRQFCAPPQGWVVTSNDCDPTRNSVRPGGTEVCDGLDNDCANGVDDAPVGLQQDCDDATKQGICRSGREACVGGVIVCKSKVTPKEETCDGTLDEDCDGVVDNRPGCGGPANLLTAPGVQIGAGELNAAVTDPGFTACQRGNIVASENVSTNNVWTGNGYQFHVFWAEKTSGSWDLSRSFARLRVSFNARVTLNPNATQPWHTIGQPIFLFCSRTGDPTRIRYNTPSRAWMTASPGPYTSDVPLAGGGSWTLIAGGALQDVYRVEVIIKPSTGGGGIPAFQVDWLELGF